MPGLYQGVSPVQGRSPSRAYNLGDHAGPMTAAESSRADPRTHATPPRLGGAALIVMVGVPGSGKSFLARAIAERFGAELVQTDAVRKELFRRPRYTLAETRAVYATCHRRLKRGLAAGPCVVFDATNLQDRARAALGRIAEQRGAELVVVVAYATEAVIRARLAARARGHDPHDLSDADWVVHLKLRRAAEPIERPHMIANTCTSPRVLLDALGRRLGR